MTLEYKNPAGLSEADLLELIDNKVPESKTLDYKLELKFGDSDKRELLADISSFANTAGGYLLFGIKEEGGIPTEIAGLSIDNPDKEILKIVNLIRDCTDPHIPGVSIHAVPLTNSKYVLAAHIPRSWNAPHVVKIEKHWRFYARHSAGKYPLDVPELKQAFLLSESISERIRRFHAERVGLVASREVPVLNLQQGPSFIFHILPISAFQAGDRIDLSSLEEKQIYFRPLGASGFSTRYNLDGLLTFDEHKIGDEFKVLTYNQLFRNGIVEAVATDYNFFPRNDTDNAIHITHYEQEILMFLSSTVESFKKMEIEPPFILMMSLTGVKHRQLYVGNRYSFRRTVIDRDVLPLPDVLVRDYGFDPGQEMRPIFDAIWNAAGWARCFNYDDNGKWTGRG